MDTQVQIGTLVWTVPGISKEDIHMLADKNHWAIRELGEHGTIDAPVTIGNWKYEPLGDSTLPRLAAQRKNLILKSGEPLQWIVGHDLTEHKPLINIPWSMVLKVAGIAIGAAMAAVVVSVLLAALIAALAPVVLVLGALAVCATGDPALICVTAEGNGKKSIETTRTIPGNSCKRFGLRGNPGYLGALGCGQRIMGLLGSRCEWLAFVHSRLRN